MSNPTTNIQQTLLKICDFCLELIFPTSCLGCQQTGTELCPQCLVKIKIKLQQVCPICQKLSPAGQTCLKCQKFSPLTGLHIASHYTENHLLMAAIKRLKYRFARNLSPKLSTILMRNLPQKILTQNPTLVPVPLHYRRQFWRGFNQAELLSQALSQQLNLPTANLLKRTRSTPPQTQFKRTARLKNLGGAFQFCPPKKIPQKVLLIDDVATTLTTLQECAKILRANGIPEVWGLVLARG